MVERVSGGPDAGQRGFTVIEVLIALVVLLVGMAGILSMQLSSVQATAFSRHATEASILGEDKMEWLRTQPLASLTACTVADACTDTVNADGVPDPEGLYERKWMVTPDAAVATRIRVEVIWQEYGGREDYTIALSTQRQQ